MSFRTAFPRTAAALAALAATAFLAACGDDDAQTLNITVSGPAKFEAPAAAEAGLAEITFENAGKAVADTQLIRVEGDHSAAETVRALGGAMRGKGLPEWFFAAGGAPAMEPGTETAVTQVLRPGTYYLFNTEGLEGPPDPADVPAIEVTGEVEDAELPEADATVNGFDYGFKAQGLQAGENEILFENTGEEPHHLIAAPIAKGKTFADVKKFLRDEKGEPPVDQEDEVVTAVIEGGESQIVTLDLKAGDYALLCFITDREGGPPHAFKGMVSPATVPAG